MYVRFPSRPAAATALLCVAASPAALAHPGHGAAAPHGHATDAWGFVVVALLFAAAAAGRRK